ncbi:hypothetical protein [Pseudoflavonifractor phocaeensis]|uniref:hypothetical protein n=1 Tax=Pseudoflavonifractor phocaeensis TaxID=1870988 RepID=UPI00195AC7E0|nr:hypothetical protein [Pseudoflavonifractor phocaeensis]MBM6723797.1 hypothetical protein [Pseudoflavonifractor phocaeensis]
MEQTVANSIFIPSGKGTKALNGAESTPDPQLITRRSKVQILPPQPEKTPDFFRNQAFFYLKNYLFFEADAYPLLM